MKEKKKNWLEEAAKEQVKEFSKETIETYTEITNDEGKSKKLLIIGGIVLCVLVLGWWFFSDGAKAEREAEQVPTGNLGTIEEETTSTDEINVKQFSNHDEKIAGLWGPEDFDLEKFSDASYDAYNFNANGSVIKVMAEHKQSLSEFGEWSNDGNGNIYISWKDKDGNEFFSETIEYKYVDDEEDGEILTLNGNDYYPLTNEEAVIFS